MADNDDSKKRRILSKGNPHDAYFKAVIGEAFNANDLLRKHLPKDITSQFSSDMPQKMEGSFVDEVLAPHLSDILYRVKLNTGNEAFVYTLIEHKSYPDTLAPLQLLKYMTRIWSDWSKENKGKNLPVIIPLIFYHGKSRWAVSTSFSGLFEDIPKAMQSCIPDFLYELVDLGQIDDQDLANDKRLSALLMPMKYIFTPELMLELTKTTDNILKLERMDILLSLTYIIKARTDIGRNEVDDILDILPSPEQEDIMAGLAQEFRDEWYDKGKTEGFAAGEAKFLIRLLERRFGSLSQETRERVISADTDTLELWGDRLLDAPNLAAVFGDAQ